MTAGDSYWPTAARVLTDRELHAIVLRDMLNLGTRRIALYCGVSRATIRDRLDTADRKIHDALRKDAA